MMLKLCAGQNVNFRKQVWRQTLLLTAIVLLLSGCSWFSTSEDSEAARTLPPLEVPPDLLKPVGDERLARPELPRQKPAVEPVPVTPTLASIGERVLPPGKGVQRLRDGQDRWLLVAAEPEQVWPLVRQFLERRGYRVLREEAEIGLLETDWKSRFFETEEQTNAIPNWRERLRFRLEPAQQVGSTEVYLSQHNSERVKSSAEGDSYQWLLRAPDNDRAIEMLNRFANYLVAENVEEAVALTPLASHIGSDEDNNTALVVEAEFEKVWRRTALAVEDLGFVIEDRDRTNGLYTVYNELPSGKTEEELRHGKPQSATIREEFRIHLSERGEQTFVTIRNEAGQNESNEAAIHLLNLIHGQFQ